MSGTDDLEPRLRAYLARAAAWGEEHASRRSRMADPSPSRGTRLLTVISAFAVAAVVATVLAVGVSLRNHRETTPSVGAVEPPAVSSSPCPAAPVRPVTPDRGTLIALKMLSLHTGWLAVTYFAPDSSGDLPGGSERVFRTIDCGHSWTDVTPQQLATRSRDGIITLTAVDSRHAWIATWVQNGTPTVAEIWRTSDGGASWERTDVQLRPQGNLSLFFLDRDRGWMAATVSGDRSKNNLKARLYSTTDGGASWTEVRSDASDGTVPVAAIAFLDRDHGWGVPEPTFGGDLYYTGDGGRSWSRRAIPSPDGFGGLVQAIGLPTFTDTRDGVLPVRLGSASVPFPRPGQPAAARFDLYVTHDGGESWTPTTPLADVPAVSAWTTPPSYGVLSATHWVVTTESAMYTTMDAGRNWRAVSSTMGLPPQRGPLYPSVVVVAGAFPTDTAWWVVYEYLGCTEGCSTYGILRTVDGGQTWVENEPPTPT